MVKYLRFNINNEINKAIQYHQTGHLQRAKKICKRILEVDPNHSWSLHLLGCIANQVGQNDIAVDFFNKAIQNDPKNPIYYNNLGNAFLDQGKLNEAISCYKKALQLKPDLTGAYYNMGIAFQGQGELDEAMSCYQKALQSNPGFAEVYSPLIHQLQRTCAWQELDGLTAKLDGVTKKSLANGTRTAEAPFISITRHADPSLNFAIAKSWSCDITRAMSNLKIHFSFYVKRACKTKITVGYLSNDFRDHATAHLMLSLFGLHNRDEFKIFCYSYGEDDGSYHRARIQHDCDKFVDLFNLDHADAAKCIYENQVDILVDLKGYTEGNRLAICALRPAPIQVSYLGFPGTTGSDFFDYIITDKIVTPEDHAPYYSENFVYLPHCYQVNDHTQSISNKEWKKADFELPEDSFIFCSFNRPYKIDPMMFDIWMRLLQQVPEGILWMQLGNDTAEKNLRREAEARGVKSERLIFAERLPKDEHLARLKLADLVLDTRICNGHTTTSDALWAGVPVITLQGSHFASRVSSSILFAIGLPELITYSLEEYKALAVRLAHNPVELQEIRQRLAKNRLVAPLFDTPRFVRNLETAYKEMWKIFLAGEVPRQIEILEG